MNVPDAVVISLASGIVLSAVAWGKTQQDVSWIKKTCDRLEETCDRLESRFNNLPHHSEKTPQ